MILRVCRRALGDEHEAQDAFQATFLVLIRRAGSLQGHESLGGWLHAVACRVATCARAAQARRRARERRMVETAAATIKTEGWDDLGTVLHEEIGRLPAAYRAAVVLCDLEGLTQEQAAQRLGCPSGTVRSRRARGRARLQARLARRGLAPAAGGLAALLAAEAAGATVPAELVTATVRAAILTAAGQSIAGAGVAALTQGALRSLFMTRLKIVSAAVLVMVVTVSGTVGLAFQQTSGPSRETTVQTSTEEESRRSRNGPSGITEPGPLSETPPQEQSAKKEGEDEIDRRTAELKRAQDRYIWALRMFAKGYVSPAETTKDKEAVERAMDALERACAAKRKPQTEGKAPGDRTPEERKREEANLIPKEIERVQEELKWMLMSLHRLQGAATSMAPVRDKSPEPLTEAEWKIAEARVTAMRAQLELKKAELKLLELRLDQSKQ
jgi:RNA polymerase sigma factor (sigma-70 family)